MTRIACNVFASAFFGGMAAALLDQISIHATWHSSVIGFVGYMGGLTSELCYTIIRKYRGRA